MATTYDVAVKLAGKVDPSLIKSSQKASGLISSIVKADLIASGIKSAASAVASFAVESVKSFASFEQSLANAGAIAGATGEDLQAMKDAAMEAGRTTQFTAAQSADALGYMALAGWDTKTSIQALQPVLKMAQATGADLATTSDQVTDSMSAMGIEVKNLNSYLDVLVQTNNKSNTTASALMEAMIGAGSAAKAAGMDYKQTAVALGVLANNGIKGAEAGTALNSMLSRMTSNKQALAAYKKLGVSVFDANGKIRDFGTILKETDKQLSKLSDEKRAAIIKDIAGVNYGGQYQFLLKGVRAVEGQASEWEKLKENIDNAGGSLEAMNSKATDTMLGAWARFQSAIDGARLALIEKFSPQIKIALDFVSNNILPKATKAIEKFTSKLINLGTFVKNVATVLFEFGTGADFMNAKMYLWSKYGFDFIQILEKIKTAINTIVPIMMTLSTKILSFIGYLLNIKQVIADVNNFYREHEDLINVIGIALAGLTTSIVAYNAAAIAGAIASHAIAIGLGVYSAAVSVATAVTTAFGAVMAFVTSPIFLVVAAITAVIVACYFLYKYWDKVTAFFKEAWIKVCDALKSAWQWYIDLWKLRINQVKAVWSAICNFFSSVWQGVCNYFVNAWNNAVALVQTIWEGIKALFAMYVENFKLIFNGICDFITNVFSGNFKGAWDAITGIFTGIWENFKNIAKAPLNWIIDKINTVINGINSVKVPDWVPGVGGMGANIANIPALASGGIISKPTLAMVGEGNESEAVIPLSKLDNILSQNRGSDFGNFAKSQPASANFGGNSVTFAPVINVKGGAGASDDIKSALSDGFAEFKKYMAQYQNETRRRSFSGF